MALTAHTLAPPPVLKIARLGSWVPPQPLVLAPGEMLALRIRSHATRASLMAWLTGDAPPERGAVQVLGHDLAARRHLARPRQAPAVAFVPADGGLFANLNAWENIWTPATYHHPDTADELAWRVRRLLATLGMEPGGLMARRPEEMAPVERRLVAFARAVMLRPELLVVDGLFDDLDAQDVRQSARLFPAFAGALPFRALLALGAIYPEDVRAAGVRVVDIEEPVQ